MNLAMRRILIVTGALLLATKGGYAQVARVTASQRTTELKAGETEWAQVGVGANIGSKDRFRTGKRSKADLKFRDGSLVRLGQLSYLEMRGAKQMNLLRGQVLFVALRPGRILAGSAAAAIKGSVALVQYQNYKNSESKEQKAPQFYLYSGLMDVISTTSTVSLQPGQMATVLPDGTIQVSIAPPLQYFGGELHPSILEKPLKNPYAGSKGQVDWRDDPERIERDHNLAAFALDDGRTQEEYTFPRSEPDPFVPPPSPFVAGLTASATAAGPGLVNPGGGLNMQSFQGQSRMQWTKSLRFAAADDAKTVPQVLEDAAAANAEEEKGEFDLDATAAYKHLEEAQFDLGREIGGDAALVGALANRGTYAYAARFHGYYARDKWFADAAYFPMRIHSRFDGENKTTRDFSAISDLSLTYSDKWGEAQFGRQRFLSGPVQAATYGSLVRSGGREVMDAVRVAPRIRDNMSLELAYLVDAYPRKLPYRISGRQNGYYGRFGLYESFGNFGINLLKYQDSEVDNTTGATLDFSLPVLRDKVEFYGEVGRDPYRRNLRTFGLTFPFLYEKTGWDLYLETARLGDGRDAAGPPREYTVRGYRRVNENINVVAAVSKFSGASTRMTVGMSIGVRTQR